MESAPGTERQDLPPIDLQREALAVFTALCDICPSCKGRLALCCSGPLAFAAALAVTGLGGAALVLEETTPQTPATVLPTDFTVTDLAEALRILKNELRKQRPVSVCLRGHLAGSIGETVQRGLAPDLLCAPHNQAPVLRPFLRPGTVLLGLPAVPPSSLSGFRMKTDVAGSFIERRQTDQLLQGQFAEEGIQPELVRTVNARWMAVAPRLFPRNRHRVLWSAE